MSYDRDGETRCDKCGEWHPCSDDRLWGMCTKCREKEKIVSENNKAHIWVVVGESGKDLTEGHNSPSEAQEWADRELGGGCYHIEHRIWDEQSGDFKAI